MPLTTCWTSAAGGHSPPFSLLRWPRVPPLDRASARVREAPHLWGAWAIHAAAAAWHRLVKRDSVLSRMLPGIR